MSVLGPLVNRLEHRVEQLEREHRRKRRGVPVHALRCDLDLATREELLRLEEILREAGEGEVRGDEREELARLCATINTRTERPERAWTPPVTAELVEATRTARAEGRSILPVTDSLTVELPFLDGPQAESHAALDLLPKLDGSVQERTEPQRSDEKAAALVGVGRSTVAQEAPPEVRRELERRTAEAEREHARALRRERALRHARREPSEAVRIMEMKF